MFHACMVPLWHRLVNAVSARPLSVKAGENHEKSGTDDHDLSRIYARQVCKNLGHQGQSFTELGAACDKHYHRNLKFGGVLLKAQVAVGSEENVELHLGQREQFAVFNATPASFLNGYTIMPDQRAAQTPVETFINENAHSRRLRAFSIDRLQ